MKHIKEYEDKDVRDLMGDLATIGHEQLKGYYIQTTAEDGFVTGHAIFAHNEGELEETVKQMWPSHSRFRGFPERVGEAYKGPNTLHNNFLDAFSSWLSHNELSLNTIILKDLTIKDVRNVEAGGSMFPAYNPFLASEMLESCFTNIKEKMTSGEFREDFDEEREGMII